MGKAVIVLTTLEGTQLSVALGGATLKPLTKTLKGFMAVYMTDDGEQVVSSFPTKEAAIEFKVIRSTLVAIIDLSDFEEGHGL